MLSHHFQAGGGPKPKKFMEAKLFGTSKTREVDEVRSSRGCRLTSQIEINNC